MIALKLVVIGALAWSTSVSFSQGVDLPPDSDLPQSVSQEVANYNKRMEKARKDYSSAVLKAGQHLEKYLRAATRRAMRASDLESANKLKLLLEKISDGNKDAILAIGWRTLFRGVTGEHFHSNIPEQDDGTFAIPLTDNKRITHLRLTNLRSQ